MKFTDYPIGTPASGDLFPISRAGLTRAIDFDKMSISGGILEKHLVTRYRLLQIPDDFVSLVSVSLRCLNISTTGGALSGTIANQYQKPGDLASTVENDTINYIGPGVSQRIVYLDISSVFTGIDPGDTCYLLWTNTAPGNLTPYFVELVYT